MKQIGLVGVGFVGKLFVDALREADRPLTAYDADDAQTAYARERGATAAASPADVAREADVVLLSLPGRGEVADVMEGDDGLLGALSEGQVVVDTTTTGPETAERYAAACADRGAGFLTAPLTRSAPREGVMMMVGGDADTYRDVADTLDRISDDHTRIGDPGDAQTFKLMLQLRYAGHRAVDAEIVEFGRDNGVDPRLLNEFLGMDVWERYFDGDFAPDIEGLGGLAIWHKDIGYALDVARENDTATPLSGDVHEAYKAAVRAAGPDEGHAAAVVRYWRRLNGRDDGRAN